METKSRLPCAGEGMGELEIGSRPLGNSGSFGGSVGGALGKSHLVGGGSQIPVDPAEPAWGHQGAGGGVCTLCSDAAKTKSPSVYWYCITWKHAQETHTIHWMSYGEKSHRLPAYERFHHTWGATVAMCPAGSSQLTRADSRHQTQLCIQWSIGSLNIYNFTKLLQFTKLLTIAAFAAISKCYQPRLFVLLDIPGTPQTLFKLMSSKTTHPQQGLISDVQTHITSCILNISFQI